MIADIDRLDHHLIRKEKMSVGKREEELCHGNLLLFPQTHIPFLRVRADRRV